MKRSDDYLVKNTHLKELNDETLKNRFWELAGKLVDPLLDLAYKNTTPSIERSVLLRMGFSSLEAKAIVQGVMERGLMGKGAGHVVYKLATEKEMGIRDAGLSLIEGKYWDEVVSMFKGGVK